MKDPSVQYAHVPQELSETNGLVVRQKTQFGEALAQSVGLPFEARNKYKVHKLPTNKVVKSEPNDPDGWSPSAEEMEALEPFLFAQEESDMCVRLAMTCCGCRGLRPMKLHISVMGSTGDVYLIDRPFRCGGCCCQPFEMSLFSSDPDGSRQRIGRVREDFAPYFSRCCSAMCLATTYTDIEREMPDGSFEKRYSLRTNISCCGRVNNCCGATCLRSDAVYDILDTQGKVVAHLQKTYGAGQDCCAAFCRMSYGFSNYILEFPRDSTPEDRMLLLTAMFQVEFILFEQQQNNN